MDNLSLMKYTYNMKRGKLRRKSKDTIPMLREECDRLMQDINRASGGNCEVCGMANEVLHHYHTKANSSFLRYDWRNGIKLCNSCHFKHHKRFDVNIHNTVNRKRGQIWIDELEKVRRNYIKLDRPYYENIKSNFTILLQEI